MRSKTHPEVAALAKRVRQTIESLERYQKKATRLCKKTISNAEFSAGVGEWKKHQAAGFAWEVRFSETLWITAAG